MGVLSQFRYYQLKYYFLWLSVRNISRLIFRENLFNFRFTLVTVSTVSDFKIC